MQYYFSKILNSDFEEAITKTTAALKTEGFGIITVIDMQASFREKLGVEFKKYKILGACNPGYAYKAVQMEEKIGSMLPCNVIVIDKGNGTTEVAAVNPPASMMAIRNPGLEPLALEISQKLERVIHLL